MEVKVILAGGCKGGFLVIEDEVGSVNGFGRETQEQCFVFCVPMQ